MILKHKVQINVAGDGSGETKSVMKSGIRKVPKRLLNRLFGGLTEVLVIAPGQSVQSVEIHEIKEGGKSNE